MSAVALTGEAWSGPADPDLRLHLAMDDAAPTPLVRDATRQHHQLFQDPTGDPNTRAHSTDGPTSVGGHTPFSAAEPPALPVHVPLARALRFDGGDDLIDCGPDWMQGGDCALAFWFRLDQEEAGSRYFCCKHVAAGAGFRLYVHQYAPGDVRLICYLRNGPNPIYVYVSTAPGSVAVGVWNHAVLQRRGATTESWFNGTEYRAHGDFPLVNAEHLRLGFAQPTGNRPKCSLADFRIYSRALTEAEVAALATVEG